MRSGTMLALLIVLAYCAFGLVATFEPMNAAKQWTWRIVYGLVGLACLGGFVWAVRPRK